MHRRSVLLVFLALAALLIAAPAAHAKKKKKYVVKEKVSLSAGENLVVRVEGNLEPCGEWECYLFVTNPKKDPSKEALVFVTIENDGSYELRSRSEESMEAKASSPSKSGSKDKEDSDEDSSETYVTPSGVELQVKSKPKDLCSPIELAEYRTWEKSKDKAAGGDSAAEESSEDSGDDSDWMALPVLTYEQRKACNRRGAAVKTYEANEFTDGDPLAIKEDKEEPSEEGEATEDAAEEGKESKFAKSSLSLEATDGGRQIVIPSSILPSGDFDVSTNGYWGAHVGEQKIGSSSRTGVIRVER
ncbi:MAG: hypothetical protein VX498_09530 [Myxococcota bacterium]|nr:hypothetical protein [Myxococcota bacterium]